jgi:hypothetical protein
LVGKAANVIIFDNGHLTGVESILNYGEYSSNMETARPLSIDHATKLSETTATSLGLFLGLRQFGSNLEFDCVVG